MLQTGQTTPEARAGLCGREGKGLVDVMEGRLMLGRRRQARARREVTGTHRLTQAP